MQLKYLKSFFKYETLRKQKLRIKIIPVKGTNTVFLWFEIGNMTEVYSSDYKAKNIDCNENFNIFLDMCVLLSTCNIKECLNNM